MNEIYRLSFAGDPRMPAKIIAAVNPKGGSGKSTLSMQLTGALARRGHEALIVDDDLQGTATR